MARVIPQPGMLCLVIWLNCCSCWPFWIPPPWKMSSPMQLIFLWTWLSRCPVAANICVHLYGGSHGSTFSGILHCHFTWYFGPTNISKLRHQLVVNNFPSLHNVVVEGLCKHCVTLHCYDDAPTVNEWHERQTVTEVSVSVVCLRWSQAASCFLLMLSHGSPLRCIKGVGSEVMIHHRGVRVLK